MNLYAGDCTAGGSIWWLPTPGVLATGATGTLSLTGSCDVTYKSGARAHVSFALANALNSVGMMTCAEGALSGLIRVAVGADTFFVNATAVLSGGVIILTGTNDANSFSITGTLRPPGATCPTMPSGGWSGNFVVEDPTIDPAASS